MKKLLSLFTALPLVAILMFSPLVFADTGDIVVEGKSVTGKIEVGGGTLEFPNSDTLPGTCVIGDTYILTDAASGQQCYVCESANVWTPQGSFYGAAYFPDYNEADQGVTGNGKSAKAYIDTISTNSATLVFRHNSGSATTTYTFSTSETIPSNTNVIIEKGAILSTAAAQTLTINGSFGVGLYQMFSGAGVVCLSQKAVGVGIYPQWWGGMDGSHFNSAIAALPTGGGTIFVTESATLTSTIEVSTLGVKIAGSGSGRISTEPVLTWNGAVGADSKMIHVQNHMHGFVLERIRLNADEKADHCLHVQADAGSSTHDVTLSYIHFERYRVYGLILGTDNAVNLSNAQMRTVECNHLVFRGGAAGLGATAILINAQNAEFINFYGLYIDPSIGYEHTNHIFCKSGAINIYGLVTTRATGYPIITHTQLNIYGWRAEDRYLIEWKSVAIGAPCFISGVLQRSGAGALFGDHTIKIYGITDVITLSSIKIQGSIYLGPTDLRNINAQGVDFVLAGADFLFAGPSNTAGILHNTNTGVLALRGSAPSMQIKKSDGTAVVEIGQTLVWVVAGIVDGDATPTVAGGKLFTTNNSGATTITAFDDGVLGQEIIIVFGDANTTIDFSATNLEGNGGIDWSPVEGDYMTCVRVWVAVQGTKWFCNIVDTI